MDNFENIDSRIPSYSMHNDGINQVFRYGDQGPDQGSDTKFPVGGGGLGGGFDPADYGLDPNRKSPLKPAGMSNPYSQGSSDGYDGHNVHKDECIPNPDLDRMAEKEDEAAKPGK